MQKDRIRVRVDLFKRIIREQEKLAAERGLDLR